MAGNAGASMHTVPRLGSHVIVMKIGSHGEEDLTTIIERKGREAETTGFCFWGYGGALCHPIRQILPHVEQAGGDVTCLFVRTNSNPGLRVTHAAEYSSDGQLWTGLPAGHEVMSSKWALVLGDLRAVDHPLNLMEYEVAVGPSTGKNLVGYLRGRADKACARRIGSADSPEATAIVRVDFAAELVAPYAVFLR